MNNFKYDIAISLCKQDIDFARNLVAQFNPNLKVFFYETKQEEIVSKSGPEAFAKVFKEESRVIVILSREEWGDSYYTQIEKNAIIDRTAGKQGGFNFLCVIPMEPGQTPTWYPSTRIYLNPALFSIEQLARFIEFKLTEEGGEVKPLTLEDSYNSLQNKLKQKTVTVQLQWTSIAIEQAKSEIKNLKDSFNQKIHFLQNDRFDLTEHFLFSDFVDNAHLRLGDHLLHCKIIKHDEMDQRNASAQDFGVVLQLLKINGANREVLEKESLLFFYSSSSKGWALPIFPQKIENNEFSLLFRNIHLAGSFDLKNPISSEILLDQWFKNLLKKASKSLNNFL